MCKWEGEGRERGGGREESELEGEVEGAEEDLSRLMNSKQPEFIPNFLI